MVSGKTLGTAFCEKKLAVKCTPSSAKLFPTPSKQQKATAKDTDLKSAAQPGLGCEKTLGQNPLAFYYIMQGKRQRVSPFRARSRSSYQRGGKVFAGTFHRSVKNLLRIVSVKGLKQIAQTAVGKAPLKIEYLLTCQLALSASAGFSLAALAAG